MDQNAFTRRNKRRTVSKLFSVLLVTLFVLFTSFMLIILLTLWGIAISNRLAAILTAAWVLYSFSSAYFQTWIWLSLMNVRKPMKDEENKLESHFSEILRRAGIVKNFRLMIEEAAFYNAYAIGLRTIVVSRALFEDFGSEELKGVLAHELGHLQSKDCLMASAFCSPGFLLQFIWSIYAKIKRVFIRVLVLSLAYHRFIYRPLRFALIGCVLYWIFTKHLLPPMIGTILIAWAYPRANRLFLYFWNMASRFTEYKQDKFAYALGYGAALRKALMKLTSNGPQAVSAYDTVMRGDHPVIFNRIRRLERLEGIR
jgi:Zn-dependent protease with chaperone function